MPLEPPANSNEVPRTFRFNPLELPANMDEARVASRRARYFPCSFAALCFNL
jgi:hypothetical protein